MNTTSDSLFEIVTNNGRIHAALTDSARARCRAADRRAAKRDRKLNGRRERKLNRQSQSENYELQS